MAGPDSAILVTGASTGIGRAAVAEAVRQGARAYASVRREEDATSLALEFGARVHPLVFDVVDENAVLSAARAVAQQQQGRRLMGLVNNAGGSVPGPLLRMTSEELRHQFEVNLIGVHNVTRAFAPLLGVEGDNALDAGAPGRIVMISSVGGKRAAPFIAAYAASKFALEGYSEGLRRELMPFGVDVVVIGPGAVKTAIWDKGLAFDRRRYSNSIYGPALEQFTAAVAKQAEGGLAPERLGKLIWATLTTPNPRVRYRIVPNWVTDAFLPGFLSPRALDGVIARRFGLERRA